MDLASLHTISHGFYLPSCYSGARSSGANGLHCRLKNDPRIVGGKEEKNKSELQDAADAASDSDERKQAESNNQTPSEAVYCSGRIRPTLSFRSGTESEGPTAPQTLNPEA
ncbi:uncharacterized protein LOC110091837 isoform X5 [Dendrobium catenatum]|uniref:uncharacterized protein LOC110091837 isoform X5 n=1 Tax=Dendrobium catenatum TaxID=906689 RepID=UPI0009F197C4|nr:uncharacterized protein LOC110091837 isoform X5 [Dendrobium catenatum]